MQWVEISEISMILFYTKRASNMSFYDEIWITYESVIGFLKDIGLHNLVFFFCFTLPNSKDPSPLGLTYCEKYEQI